MTARSMRRSLITTVTATTVMVLLAMLVPMAVLVKQYAVEDRLAQAALEVQATETVVSGQDKGSVAVYLESINSDDSVRTTVLYPDGVAIGPDPGEDSRVRAARTTGQARVDDVSGGAEILVPVALGGNTALPEDTPVIRVHVLESGFTGSVYLAWAVLALLGVALLAGSLLMADRLGRRFVQPIRSLASSAQAMGTDRDTRVELEGPREVQEVAAALDRLGDRISTLIAREREGVADLSHRLRTPITALRLSIDALPSSAERARIQEDVDNLERMVDFVVAEARRSQREGLAPSGDVAAVVRERTDFWRPLAEDQGRTFTTELAQPPRSRPSQCQRPGRHGRHPARQRLLLHRRRCRDPGVAHHVHRRARHARRRGRRRGMAERPQCRRPRSQHQRFQRARAVHREQHRRGVRGAVGAGLLGVGRHPSPGRARHHHLSLAERADMTRATTARSPPSSVSAISGARCAPSRTRRCPCSAPWRGSGPCRPCRDGPARSRPRARRPSFGRL